MKRAPNDKKTTAQRDVNIATLRTDQEKLGGICC